MMSLQSVAELSACSQLGVLSLAQNQLTSLDGLEGTPPTALLFQGMQLCPSCSTSSSLVSLSVVSCTSSPLVSLSAAPFAECAASHCINFFFPLLAKPAQSNQQHHRDSICLYSSHLQDPGRCTLANCLFCLLLTACTFYSSICIFDTMHGQDSASGSPP